MLDGVSVRSIAIHETRWENVLTFVADKVDFKCAGLVLAHVVFSILLTEDIKFDVLEPDAVSGSAYKPASRGGLVGD